MVGLHNLHHVSMYAFFCAAGAASLITRHCRGEEDGGGRFSSLRYADSLLMALALAVEGLLFAWHLHGRSPLDVQVHTFLLYAVLAGAVFMALEVAFSYEVILGVIRCCCFILQGTFLLLFLRCSNIKSVVFLTNISMTNFRYPTTFLFLYFSFCRHLVCPGRLNPVPSLWWRRRLAGSGGQSRAEDGPGPPLRPPHWRRRLVPRRHRRAGLLLLQLENA